MPVCDQILSIVLDWFSCLNLHRLLCACQISLYCSKLLESAKPASGNVFGPECLSVLEIQQYFSFWNPKKTLRQCCSKVHRKQYYYIFVEMTGVFKVNMSRHSCRPHTLSVLLFLVPSLSHFLSAVSVGGVRGHQYSASPQ